MPRGDFARVLAEFWADGPKSETPPGHWNMIANHVVDSPGLRAAVGGRAPSSTALEWDVKLYLALNGAVHDAAIAAWGIKGDYDSRAADLDDPLHGRAGAVERPEGPSYDPEGLPLVPGLIEVITTESSAPGERHAAARRSRGRDRRPRAGAATPRSASEVGGVGWILAVDWVPYQRRTFVTPAFPGFISGHSTFSRAAAEVLTRVHRQRVLPGRPRRVRSRAPDYLTFEKGPSTDVALQWATYYDAADQAGQSRLYGGIHIAADDFTGRKLGARSARPPGRSRGATSRAPRGPNAMGRRSQSR